MPQRDGGGCATGPANRCQRGRISHLKTGWTDRGIMKLLTSKQAAESPADGRADVGFREASAFSYASRYILSKSRDMNTGRGFVYFQDQSSTVQIALRSVAPPPASRTRSERHSESRARSRGAASQ
ncbi:unnamed protein product [Pleuronectes platessa]|uniref:Uncharacterized protein n=1 Tax=Pleuronectes platessa TaxID=8262 RepID=A0A9N7VQ85_PLEPL|nr:unnamed protein product [Pleuronectes platessa]